MVFKNIILYYMIIEYIKQQAMIALSIVMQLL